MIGHLYRYPHPDDFTRFIYCGQGAERDQEHRSGKSSFGRRFKHRFPDVVLPQPIIETVEAQNQTELSEFETIWIFQYHTWHGLGGMNLRLPDDREWQNIGRMGGFNQDRKYKALGGFNQDRKDKIRGGTTSGRRAAESGHCARIARLGGRANVESGHILTIGTTEGSRKGGITQNHNRWHVRRGIKKAGCNFCEVI
jgi:hypothetical protein